MVAEPVVTELEVIELEVAEFTVAELEVTEPEVAEFTVSEPEVSELVELSNYRSMVTEPAVTEPAFSEFTVSEPVELSNRAHYGNRCIYILFLPMHRIMEQRYPKNCLMMVCAYRLDLT